MLVLCSYSLAAVQPPNPAGKPVARRSAPVVPVAFIAGYSTCDGGYGRIAADDATTDDE